MHDHLVPDTNWPGAPGRSSRYSASRSPATTTSLRHGIFRIDSRWFFFVRPVNQRLCRALALAGKLQRRIVDEGGLKAGLALLEVPSIACLVWRRVVCVSLAANATELYFLQQYRNGMRMCAARASRSADGGRRLARQHRSRMFQLLLLLVHSLRCVRSFVRCAFVFTHGSRTLCCAVLAMHANRLPVCDAV
jgi:hypothetical protein